MKRLFCLLSALLSLCLLSACGQEEAAPDPAGFDSLSALYGQVLEDLWGEDAALNEGITQLGMDLSQSGLSQSEQTALAEAFAGEHGLPVIQGTWQELVDQGYIDGENLYWEDGVFFSIRREQDAGAPGLVFTAEKWRSGTGAYLFCDCTSTQDKNGHWSDYTVGAFAIS